MTEFAIKVILTFSIMSFLTLITFVPLLVISITIFIFVKAYLVKRMHQKGGEKICGH
jgi:hypothetical protein